MNEAISPMMTLRCPICDRQTAGAEGGPAPYAPFCSERCRLIDLGRWLKEAYRLPARPEGTPPDETDDREVP